ncbi:MAG TPA: hypothetical protein VG871_02565 [Vicinamibacterales bacterium]|nr:hypothetical protein [Vicinamibacterales bacterium]
MLSVVMTLAAALTFAQTPQPFPQPGGRSSQQRPAAPPPTATAPQQPAAPAPPAPATTAPTTPAVPSGPGDAAPTEAMLGVPVFPNAQFITSYYAGRGQRYYIFGTAASFVDLVNYYRATLKQRGELTYEVPATHEFDVGKFDEDRMAFPPGVVIKDFQSDVSQGYPNPKPGGQPARFPTIIQIVPVPQR